MPLKRPAQRMRHHALRRMRQREKVTCSRRGHSRPEVMLCLQLQPCSGHLCISGHFKPDHHHCRPACGHHHGDPNAQSSRPRSHSDSHWHCDQRRWQPWRRDSAALCEHAPLPGRLAQQHDRPSLSGIAALELLTPLLARLSDRSCWPAMAVMLMQRRASGRALHGSHAACMSCTPLAVGPGGCKSAYLPWTKLFLVYT